MRPLKQSKVGCKPTNALPLAIVTCSILILLTVLILPRAPVRMEGASYANRRTELYESMAADLEEHGARFLIGGSTSQALSLSDIFRMKDGNIEPILKPAEPPVRAVVLYLDPQYARPISDIVRKILAPFFPKDVWYQGSDLYHFSMFHASHHLEPVSATPSEVKEEARVVETVAGQGCELSVVLERVVLTSTGVLLGCWQVLNGTDPAVIRKDLQNSLPRAPVKQLVFLSSLHLFWLSPVLERFENATQFSMWDLQYNEVMLHTSFARLLGPPANSNSEKSARAVFQQLVLQLNRELHGYKALVKEMWFVEELDVLALALKGRIRNNRFHLGCNQS